MHRITEALYEKRFLNLMSEEDAEMIRISGVVGLLQ